MKTLTPKAIEEALPEIPGWSYTAGRLTREWVFPTFPEAIVFVGRIAALAEAANHHPDIDIRYTKITLCLVSHDAGGLTQRDFSMAKHINSLEHP